MKITPNALKPLRQGQLLYRLRKPFSVVQFDQTAKGRIVSLPEGAELRVVGSSQLSGCLEVLWEHQRYNIFKIDLLGPWSSLVELSPVESRSPESSRIDSGRAVVAVGACA
jgi:hypothetical protein